MGGQRPKGLTIHRFTRRGAAGGGRWGDSSRATDLVGQGSIGSLEGSISFKLVGEHCNKMNKKWNDADAEADEINELAPNVNGQHTFRIHAIN